VIRVLVGDSHPVVYVGLGAILRAETDIELVGQAHDGLEVLQLAATIDPDVILMELRLPRIDGLAVLRNLAARPHRGKVVVFTGSEDREEFVVALRLGCAGILMKSSKPELIAKSIQKVYEGEIWLDADMTAAVMRNLAMPSQTGAAPGRYRKAPRSRTQLSQREQEIMVLIAQGCKNKEIAEKMFIGEQTVKNHLHNMFEKLGVSDRLGLALYAVHNNLHVDATARRVRSWGED
jgi:two-component system nitrate/nitrite response regulator NarL